MRFMEPRPRAGIVTGWLEVAQGRRSESLEERQMQRYYERHSPLGSPMAVRFAKDCNAEDFSDCP